MTKNPERNSDLLTRIDELLRTGRVDEAIQMLRTRGLDSPALRNAMGVCLMRAGKAAQAVDVYRDLLMIPGGISLKLDAPTLHAVNYATALLLMGNVSGCRTIVDDIPGAPHPSVVRLRAAIAAWKRTLSPIQRLRCALLGEAPKPVSLDFPPGELTDLPGPELRPAA